MAKEGDMSLFNDVLEPFRRVINTNPPKDKLSASSTLNFSDNSQSMKEGNAQYKLFSYKFTNFMIFKLKRS
jgi:hypothetical protein